jgi:hypothetical protein
MDFQLIPYGSLVLVRGQYPCLVMLGDLISQIPAGSGLGPFVGLAGVG